MRKLKARVLALPFVLLAITTTFQNCSAGFTYDPGSGSLSSLGGGNDLTGVFGLKVYSAGGYAMADSMPFDPGVSYDIRATGSNTGSALLMWTIDPASTASCILNSVGVATKRELKCTTQGNVTIKLQAIWEDQTMSFVQHSHSVGAVTATPTPAPLNENIVQFRVRAGTAGGAWNDANTQILLFVGQTLRVYNDDNVNHKIQTNGQPFASQADQITPNAFKDFPVTGVIAANNTTTFDGNFGTNARIFIESIDGDARYAAAGGANIGSCASCHGGIANSNKRGSTFSGIKAAIASNRGGMANITLSDKDIQAIAYALNH
jgi:hypothetical protein